MPNRTEEERQLIDSLPEKQPDRYCNARTPRGYCHMKAGTRTDHVGSGRCWLHGGNAGRKIVTGLYSEKFKISIREQYEKFLNDPSLINLYDEFAVTKAIMAKFLDDVKEELAVEVGENNKSDFWVDYTTNGQSVPSGKAKVLLQLLETMSRMFQRIIDAEVKSKQNLSVAQVNAIIVQMKLAFSTCGECPIRGQVQRKLREIRIKPDE